LGSRPRGKAHRQIWFPGGNRVVWGDLQWIGSLGNLQRLTSLGGSWIACRPPRLKGTVRGESQHSARSRRPGNH
jgi:hypothetical protein